MKFTTHLAAVALGIAIGYELFHTETGPQNNTPQLKPVQIEMASGQNVSEPYSEAVVEYEVTEQARQAEPSAKNASELMAEIDELQERLAAAEQEVEHAAQLPANEKSNEARSVYDELSERLTYESRDEAWAYDVETRAADFLYVTGLNESVALTEASCAETVCRFSFERTAASSSANNPDFDPWRDFNDQLRTQPWWQQFNTTSARSDGSTLEFYSARMAPR